MSEEIYDVVVLGGGAGGVPAAIRASQLGGKVAIIEGRGRIAGKGTLDVKGKSILYKKIILATGAQWQNPEFPGAELEEVVNTDFLLTTQTLPQRALLFGGSPWLLEIAQFLTRFGSQVTLATTLKSLLPKESKTIAIRLRKVLKDEGIEIKTQATIENVAKKKEGLIVQLSSKEGPQELVVDTIVTLERAAALKGIGLKTIGLDEEGPFLAVNDKMETSAERVYAIGDLTAPPERHYSHRAAQMGIVAAENAMGKDISFNPRTIPRLLFTHPEAASIGLTPREARGNGYEVVVGAAPLSMNPLGMILGIPPSP